jgi:RNA polymerase sigma factor (sigma-70 family)
MKDVHPLGSVDEFVGAHIGLVRHIAKRFKWALSPSLDFEDLVSEGSIGLIKAYNKFDQSKEGTFRTFVANMVQWEIQGHLRKYGQLLYTPEPLYRLAGSILRQGLKTAAPVNVAEKLFCSVDKAREALDYLNLRIEELNRPLPGTDDEKRSISDKVPVVDDLSGIEVRDFLRTLTKRERKLLELRMSGVPQRELFKGMRRSFSEISDMQVDIGKKFNRYMEVDRLAVSELTKGKYLELKDKQDKTDKEIRTMFGIGEARFSKIKRSWGLAGMKRASFQPALVESETVDVTAAPSPLFQKNQSQDELHEAKRRLEILERENKLLKALLKHYL